MAARVYIETSVISYLTAWPSRDVVMLGHQATTREWWETRREDYSLCISPLVRFELERGDPVAATERLAAIQSVEMLQLTMEAVDLADELLAAGALPPKASDDALHVAIAATANVQFLLTWNCRHLANANMRPVIEAVCRAGGARPPVICTPDELMGASR